MVKHSHSRRYKQNKRGGSASATPWTSAATYTMANYGTQDTQYKNVFGPDPAPNAYGNYVVNQLIPGANLLPASVSSSASPLITGGRKTRKHKSKSKKGGFLGEVVNQAIVPFGLAALQYSYKNRKHNKSARFSSSRRTRKRSSRR